MRTSVVILPDLTWHDVRQRFTDAERLGFEAAYTYDHMSWRTLADGPWMGMVPLLAAVAAHTRRIRLGPLVATPNFRHPVVLAKDMMTLDRISDGRLELGLGAGGAGPDATVLGAQAPGPDARFQRFRDFVSVLDAVLRAPRVDVSTPSYTGRDVRTYPGSVTRPRPPFLVAAAGIKALGIAAEYGDAWVTYGPSAAPTAKEWFDGVARQVARFDDACDAAGRTPGGVRRMALASLDAAWQQDSPAAWGDFTGRLDAMGFTDVVIHWPRADPNLPGPAPATFEAICEGLCPGEPGVPAR